VGSTVGLRAEATRNNQDFHVRLPETLDLNAAEPLRQALVEQRGRPVVLDGSHVARLGGLCLQVLVSAQKTWAEDGQEFRIEQCSLELQQQLDLFGAQDLYADSINPSAFGG
jgi:chemotaxis protein CheX